MAALAVADIGVCGHSDCGAMTAIAACKCLDGKPALASWLLYADAGYFADPLVRLPARQTRPTALNLVDNKTDVRIKVMWAHYQRANESWKRG